MQQHISCHTLKWGNGWEMLSFCPDLYHDLSCNLWLHPILNGHYTSHLHSLQHSGIAVELEAFCQRPML